MVLDALCVEAREASGLSSETLARMATRMDLIAAHLHQFDALWLSANVLEGLFVTD